MFVALWFFLEDGSLLQNNERGILFLAAYITEKALCFDNLFVFIIIFQFFKIPANLQSLALTFGIIGALVARTIFIAIGSIVLSTFSWVMLIMGIFLIYTGIKISLAKEENIKPEKNFLLKFSKKFMNITDEFHGSRFIIKNKKGIITFTPMFLVILVIASTDIIFAIDSIPTVFGITQDLFIVWSSNMMAVVGMRPLYFLIQEVKNQFRFLKYGLGIILVIIGLKMAFEYILDYHINIYFSLSAIVVVITGSILLSSLLPEKNGSNPIKN
jgi:tellurite resistance protein TerC